MWEIHNVSMIVGLEDITEGEFLHWWDISQWYCSMIVILPWFSRTMPSIHTWQSMTTWRSIETAQVQQGRYRQTARSSWNPGLKEFLDCNQRLVCGQRQRVAMGRAIVRDAKVFSLMDEPLSSWCETVCVQGACWDCQNPLPYRSNNHLRYPRPKPGGHDLWPTALLSCQRRKWSGTGTIGRIESEPARAFANEPANKFVAGSPAANFFEVMASGHQLTDGDQLIYPDRWSREALTEKATKVRKLFGYPTRGFSRLDCRGYFPGDVVDAVVSGVAVWLSAYCKVGSQELSAKVDASNYLEPGSVSPKLPRVICLIVRLKTNYFVNKSQNWLILTLG